MTWTVPHRSIRCLAALLVIGALAAGCASADQASSTHAAAGHSHPGVPASTHHSQRHRRHHHAQPKQAKPHPHRHHLRHAKPIHVTGVPAVDVPNPALTPGAALTTSASRVCVSGYASSVRDVPDSEKEAVYAEYGIAHAPYQHEVDHLVSLELGGSNAITNLWPEPYASRWGARTKDVLENRLHDLVCAGTLTLAYAQRIEAHNWVKAYRRYVGAPPVSSGGSSGAGGVAGSSGGSGGSAGSCEPGYSPCLPVVSDLDCSQIPDSKKPIHVTGSDPYRLDGDGDGLGCE